MKITENASGLSESSSEDLGEDEIGWRVGSGRGGGDGGAGGQWMQRSGSMSEMHNSVLFGTDNGTKMQHTCNKLQHTATHCNTPSVYMTYHTDINTMWGQLFAGSLNFHIS